MRSEERGGEGMLFCDFAKVYTFCIYYRKISK